jgi:Asp-tRNA(Asn)/Glu-tRNA(Gln) amidotransferase A subunit family amidase
MADLELSYTPATELLRKMQRKEISPVEIVRNALDRIEEVNPTLNCFCFTYPEEAMEKARAAERALAAGEKVGPLHGIPVAIKDLTPTRGKRTTLGSRLYENWVPDHDAVIVERLENAGAIMVGKTTTPEFAAFSFTASPLWGITRNPWNLGYSPGGSSGGSSAAVAAGCVPMAEGCDMGGSVRIPAAFCGIVGLKPSFGRIPFEILPSQFDALSHFGPLSRTVEDSALFLAVTQGPDNRDIQSLSPALEPPLVRSKDVRGLKLALTPDYGYYEVDPEILRNLYETADLLRSLGAEVEEVKLGLTSEVNRAYYKHWTVYIATFFGHHLKNEREREMLDPLVIRQMEEGFTHNAVDFKQAEIVRTRLWQAFAPIFETYDALLCPTTAVPGLAHDETDFDFGFMRPNGRFRGLHLTEHFNMLGQCPALSVPSGYTKAGLPTGMQIVGRRYDDVGVLRIGAALEEARHWTDDRPPV